MSSETKLTKILTHKITLSSIVLLSFFLRFSNLNYNSPSLDESSYLLLGKLGIFQGNWLEYNPTSWMGGAFFFYPILSALASVNSGIVGARALNVAIGSLAIILVYLLVKNLRFFSEDYLNKLAAVVTAFFFAISPIAIILSRLAVYDILSFTLFILGIVLLQKSFSTKSRIFTTFSSLALLFSFLAKYFSFVFLPFVGASVLLWSLKTLKGKALLLNLGFFSAPLLFGFGLYFLLSLENLKIFFFEQVTTKDSFKTIWAIFLENIRLSWLFASVSLLFLVLFLRKKIYFPLFLYLIPFLILLTHLVSYRALAIEKHVLYGTVAFFTVSGIALAQLFRMSQVLFMVISLVLTFLIGVNSWQEVSKFESSWPNSTQAMTFLRERVTPHDRILAQDGSATVVLFEKIIPGQVITLFSFDYKDLSGEEAYTKAIEDRYFDFIQLDQFSENTKSLSDKIRLALDKKYNLIYHRDRIEIYKRTS